MEFTFFNDAKEIAASIYNMVLQSFTLLPVVAFVEMDPSTKMMISAFGLNFIVVSTIGLLYSKKIYVIAMKQQGSGEKDELLALDTTKSGTSTKGGARTSVTVPTPTAGRVGTVNTANH